MSQLETGAARAPQATRLHQPGSGVHRATSSLLRAAKGASKDALLSASVITSRRLSARIGGVEQPSNATGRRLRQRGSSAAASAASAAAAKAVAEIVSPDVASRFWSRFGGTHRLNFGSMFGTRDAMIDLCEQVVAVLVGAMASCWDQGMLNILVWTNLIAQHQKSTRVVVWDCFEGPVKTLDVGGLRDAHGKFYNEKGALYPLVHQFRPTRQSGFVADLAKIFPPRGANPSLTDANYPSITWQPQLYSQPLQRTAFVWDDKRRMEKLRIQIKTSGMSNPADAQVPLPAALPQCAAISQRYAECASRDERDGSVHGNAWEAMAKEGFVLAAPRAKM